jgi:predicted nucleotidyltransferase
VIGGEIVDDPDELLFLSADDWFLNPTEDEKPPAEEPAMKPPARHLRLDIVELEAVFAFITEVNPDDCDAPCIAFLDLTSGKAVSAEDGEETDALLDDENHLLLPSDLFEDMRYGGLDKFVGSLPDDPLRAKLARAIHGRGAFRRFMEIVSGDVKLKHSWEWFETCRQRERIVEWLRAENIEPDWGCDIFQAPPLPDKRADLLRAVLDFVRDARALPGVRRIALLGSLVTPKAIPKDVDLLVEVADDTPLDNLARLKRRLLGKTLQTGDSCGADVFLCDSQGEYQGRICSWKTCAPGIRRACEAQHCGRREFLYDDLQNLRLATSLVTEPPLELWPNLIARTAIPDDVREELIAGLR